MIQKIVFLDIDGTLAGLDGKVPPSALTACREARRQGHLLYLCSGRPRVNISAEVLAVGFDGVISSGGAHIETGNTAAEVLFQGTVIFDAVMPALLAKQIAAYLEEHRCGFSLEKNGETFSNRYLPAYWESIRERLGAKGKSEKSIDHIKEITKNQLPRNPDESFYADINKIVFVESGTIAFDALQQKFGAYCEIFHGSIPYCGDEGGEIGPQGVHKGSALSKIAEYHHISLADTIAFGDSDNDRTMIERAGIGIAMGNARDELKAIADDVTTDLDDNGIFNSFTKHGLI